METRFWLYAGAALLLLFTSVALFAPLVSPYDPLQQNLEQDLITHSAQHLLGTDKLGRDMLSRIIFGARISLLVGASTVALSLLIGVGVGSLSGYAGGIADLLCMRLIDILMAFPGI